MAVTPDQASTRQRAVGHREPAQPGRPWFMWGVGLWLMGALVFAVLAVFAAFFDRFPADRRIAHEFQGVDLPAFGGFIDAVNALGYWWAFLPIMIGLALAFAVMRAGWESIMVLLTAPLAGLNTLLKDWIGRPRPSSPGDAYPSGHTVAIAALFGVLFLVIPAVVPSRWLRWPLQGGCLLMIVAAGPARVYVDAHSPSDVLAGYLLVVLFLAPLFAAYWRLGASSNRKPAQSDSPG